MFTTYPETLRFLYDNLPVFQRVGSAAYKKDLTNTIRLCDLLGNPERKFRSIHVAGTNGKGSTSHMLAAVLQTAGYKTGLYTSPHLKEFTERIRVDGIEVGKQFVVDFVNKAYRHILDIRPSFFELTVAMAFEYFVEHRVDIAVIETGLGGRLDSTNVILPELSIITNIGWDHKDLLGDTLDKIAREKAGIIKGGIPAVISERQQGIDRIFEGYAGEVGAPISFASDDFIIKPNKAGGKIMLDVYQKGHLNIADLYIPLQGYYQQKNLIGVLKAVALLNDRGWTITPSNLREGLGNVVRLTGLKGRWQQLGVEPLIVCDTGHNVDGIREVLGQIKAQTFEKLHIVFGMVADKDPSEVLAILPIDAFYYFCEAKIPRAMKAEQLAGLARSAGLSGVIVADVNAAVEQARRNASTNDMIFIGGSTFVVAELNEL